MDGSFSTSREAKIEYVHISEPFHVTIKKEIVMYFF